MSFCGSQIAADGLKGRVVEVSLADLQKVTLLGLATGFALLYCLL